MTDGKSVTVDGQDYVLEGLENLYTPSLLDGVLIRGPLPRGRTARLTSPEGKRMSLNADQINRHFQFGFEKTSKEIITAAQTKVEALQAKIEERMKRVSDLRAEYKIDDKALIQLLQAARQSQRQQISYSYTTTAAGNNEETRVVGAGVVSHLLTESDCISSEKEAVKRLGVIIANLRPLPRMAESGTAYKEDSFGLSYEELDFLGFGGES